MNITGSNDITVLDFKVTYDLSAIPPVVKLENLSAGPHLTDCTWWYEVLTPSGSVIHRGSEGSPDQTGVWSPVTVSGTWPQPYGQIEFSAAAYKTTLFVKDSDGNIYSLAKEAFLCRPVGNTQSSNDNLGRAKAFAKMRCDTAQLYVEDKTDYTYKGVNPTTISRNYTLIAPQDPTGTIPAPFVVTGAANVLLPIHFNAEGYTMYMTTVMLYDLGDGNFVQIKYKEKSLFAIRCNIDLGPLLCDYQRLIDAAIKEGCVTINDIEAKDKLLIIGNYIALAHIGVTQPLLNVDVPELIEKIKYLGKFTCDCYTPGNGINGSSDSDVIINVEEVCGDIEVVSVTNVGNNWTIRLGDKSYVMVMDPDNNVAINAIFGFSEVIDTGACTKTFKLGISKAALDTYINILINTALSNYTSGCCPIFVNVYDKSTSPLSPPASCPASFFPARVYDYLGTTLIGLANTAEEMVGLLNGDATWNVKGTAFIVDNCHVGFFPATGVTAINNVLIDVVHVVNPCGEDNMKDYFIGYEACGESPFVSANDSVYVQVKYTLSGPRISIGWVSDYSDMVAKLNAEPSKPPSISYHELGNPSIVEVVDTDCAAGYQVQPLIITEVNEIVYGANHHTAGGTAPGMEVLDMHGAAYLGHVCGLPNNKIPWHVFQVGNTLYTIESDTGVLYVINVANPLYPIIVTTIALASVTGTEFTGLPKYGGTIFSHWDVYFPTDRDYNFDGFIYVMESTSGTIWKISHATNNAVAAFNDVLLIGACPRVIVNNKLYFSNDGNRATLTSQIAGVATGKILKLDLSNFASGGLSLFNCGAPAVHVYSISHGYLSGSTVCMAWVGSDGSVGLINPITDTLVGAVFSGVLGVVGGFTDITNSTLYMGKLYVSSFGNGTKVFNIDSPGDAIYNLEAPGSNQNHYNFLPSKGKCYGFLTYDANPAAVAVISIAPAAPGKLLGKVDLPAGDIYNVQPQIRVNIFDATNPNGLC